MFEVNVFIKNLEEKWILCQERFNNIEEAEEISDMLSVILHNQLSKKNIHDYKIAIRKMK